jgi:hypothetical protein
MKKILIVFSFVLPLVATPAIADPCNGRPQDDNRPGCGLTDPPIPHRGSGRAFEPAPDSVGAPRRTDHAGTH